MHRTGRTMPDQYSELLAGASRVLIIVHRKPDGDAVGSAFAMADVLRYSGKEATVLMPEGFPQKYAPLVHDGFVAEISRQEALEHDLMLVIDCATPSLAGCGAADIDDLCSSMPSLVLDHHPGNNFTSAGCKAVEPACAAAALLCFEICREMNWHITPEAATLFLLGLSTDTGGFRFSNSDSRAFRAAGELLQLGADLNAVNTNAYFSKPLNQQQLEADLVLNHLQFRCGGALAVGTVTEEMLRKYSFDMRDGEGVIERIRELQGVKAAILISPRGTGLKISSRTQPGTVSAADILKEFGGGGHKYAAGLQINENIEQTAEKVLCRFEEELNKL